LDVELVDRFLQAARTLGFPVSSRRNANKVIEAFMELVIEQANICQQQVTLLTVNYKPKIISLTVEQRIKVNMVKADLLKTLKKLEQHKGDAYADHWKNRLAKSLKNAVKVVEGTRDPELLQLLEQAEKAWEDQTKP
jgi:hypothetical protein